MEGRDQFTFYKSFREAIRRIKSKAVRAEAYDAVCDYALYGIEPNLDKMSDAAAIAFISAKPNIDASRRKADSGRKGGSSKQTGSKPEANGKQTGSKKEKEGEDKKEKEYECTPPPPSQGESDGAFHFSAFWNAYPTNRGGREAAYQAFGQLSPNEATFAQIMSALEAFRKSAQWTQDDGRFIPSAAKFLTERQYEKPPALSPPSGIPKGASGELGEAELEAIQRVLKGGSG